MKTSQEKAQKITHWFFHELVCKKHGTDNFVLSKFIACATTCLTDKIADALSDLAKWKTGAWCSECNTPQWVLENGEHDCKSITQLREEKDALRKRLDETEELNKDDDHIWKRLEKERDEARTVLSAWHSQFQTTQLTHAIAERDAHILRIQQLKSAIRQLDKTLMEQHGDKS